MRHSTYYLSIALIFFISISNVSAEVPNHFMNQMNANLLAKYCGDGKDQSVCIAMKKAVRQAEENYMNKLRNGEYMGDGVPPPELGSMRNPINVIVQPAQ